ncbi:PQQ-dependent sugar dehydrogenase [Candidatus Woesebacteria bacterium]|nr:PQQ-dependent sugar dehydrogenase [Candidatus Woesebacteria bacterium]
MIKKIIFVIVLLFLATFIWNKYGYLSRNSQNNPPYVEVSSEPVILAPAPESDQELNFVNVPEGYAISYFAKNVPGARSLALGSNGVVFVGTRSEGVVYALEDSDGDGRANNRYVVASGLNNPNGVVYHEGSLYVAEIHRIIKFEGIDSAYKTKPSAKVIYDQLPKDTHHGWRYMAMGPDNKLYLGIGAPCNVCENKDPYASISRLNLDGTGFEVVARGIRNTVGFTWDANGDLWFSDNGRDMLGDDVPSDELNKMTTSNSHFGFPYCHDGTVADPKFNGKPCNDFVSPALSLSPHAAALGIKFITDDKLLIAEHGSWNRKTPIGYRLMSVDVSGGKASNYQVFADGWLGKDGKAMGRPVDLAVMSDGSILISDDLSGTIYRLTQVK